MTELRSFVKGVILLARNIKHQTLFVRLPLLYECGESPTYSRPGYCIASGVKIRSSSSRTCELVSFPQCEPLTKIPNFCFFNNYY